MYYVYYDTDIEAVISLRPWIINLTYLSCRFPLSLRSHSVAPARCAHAQLRSRSA